MVTTHRKGPVSFANFMVRGRASGKGRGRCSDRGTLKHSGRASGRSSVACAEKRTGHMSVLFALLVLAFFINPMGLQGWAGES